MTTIQYLSYSKPKRALLKFLNFFKRLPRCISRLFNRVPYLLLKVFDFVAKPFVKVFDAFYYGDWKTRLSFLVFGFGEVTRKQKVKGILHFAFEVIFILYMVLFGGTYLSKLGSLGYYSSVQIGTITTPLYRFEDNSFLILLFSIITIIIILCAVYVFYTNVTFSKELQDLENVGKHKSDKEVLLNVGNRNYHTTLLSFPMLGLLCFTIIPMIFMVCIAFTNYNSNHLPPKELFDWVGSDNFQNLFGMKNSAASSGYLTIFSQILLWTLIWAFFATFSNYFLGMVVAILINTKGIKLKKLWRTVLVTTIAVPQFISLLLISKMFGEIGFINKALMSLGITNSPILFLDSSIITNVVIIVVNMWVGVPYTVLICTGILMNIPQDLYESARIDGASPFRMYMKITLPYMLFVTTPYLINQFVGNINNFNVIYLLSQGKPYFTEVANDTFAGKSDLLITWLYKLTATSAEVDYGLASVIGLLIFCIVAFFSLIFYSNTNSVKNEEDFQ